MHSENVIFHAIRLKAGQDLRKEIESCVQIENIQAGWIVTCVGSLTHTHMRFANQPSGNKVNGYFEIVSLVGTLSTTGCHLHLYVSNEQGNTTGGHLLYENRVYTTAEIIIAASNDWLFTRRADTETGFKELQIEQGEKKW